MNKSVIALALTIAATMPAWAGSNGTPLDESTFQDYLVRVFSGNESCGGQLIAGKYVVTAVHCVADAWGSRGSDEWMAISSDGVMTDAQVTDADLKIYFGNATYTAGTKIGVSAATLFHDYVYMYQHTGSDINSDYDAEVLSNWMTEYGLTADDVTGSLSVFGDIAVFTLSDTAQQQTSATLLTTTKAIEDGVDVRWAGWGITEEGGSTPATANYGYSTYSAFPWDSWWTQSTDADWELTNTTDGSGTCAGDSGSPVTIAGKVLGYVHGGTTSTCGSGADRLTAARFYIDWLAEQINAVNTVSKKDLTVDAAGAHSVTWTIPVQSLKVDDVTFNPQIVDSNGLFTSDDLSNCEGTFATGESCEITVTFNANRNTVSSNASATLVLNDELSIPLSYTISSTSGGDDGSTDDGSDDNGGSTGGDSGSSGGGSANWLVLVAMAGLALRRKSRR